MPTILITGGHSGIGIEYSKLLASTYHYNLILEICAGDISIEYIFC